jgi:hypothetical protein
VNGVARVAVFVYRIARSVFCWLATAAFWDGVKLRSSTSQGFKLEAGARDNLVSHMGAVHAMVTDAADDYRLKMRRHVYQVWPHRHRINQRGHVRTSVLALRGMLALSVHLRLIFVVF